MNVGIGYANSADAFICGRLAAEQALHQSGATAPNLVLAFCHGNLDAAAFFHGVRDVAGPGIPILGGSAIGVITHQSLSYEGSPAAVAAIQCSGPVRVAATDGLDRDEYSTGQRLAKALGTPAEDELLLLFYDSVKVPPSATTPPVLNASPRIIAGIESVFAGPPLILGAGLLGDYAFSPTSQFCGADVRTQAVVGAMLGSGVKSHVRIMHGCVPKDGIYHTITRMEGAVIHELDGEPIGNMIDRIYGDRSWRKQNPVKRLALGVNHGPKFEQFQEKDFVNRLIAGALPGGDGIVLFEPDLREGMEILFMLRDGETMIQSARQNARELVESVRRAGRNPGFALYIDCAGRTAVQSETLSEEAAEVQAILSEHQIPLLGFYSGVEVAPLLGQSRGLDWTGVLLLLSED